MSYILLNIWPILAATLASFVAGLILSRLGSRPGTPRSRSRGLAVVVLVAEFWLCCILAGALILAPPRAGEWTMAIGSAVVIWIGFVVPALVVSLAYFGSSGKAIAFHCFHWFVAMVLMACVLQSIGLTAPVETGTISG